jgi:hypothetical protein
MGAAPDLTSEETLLDMICQYIGLDPGYDF